jgi:hypothetical protein
MGYYRNSSLMMQLAVRGEDTDAMVTKGSRDKQAKERRKRPDQYMNNRNSA